MKATVDICDSCKKSISEFKCAFCGNDYCSKCGFYGNISQSSSRVVVKVNTRYSFSSKGMCVKCIRMIENMFAKNEINDKIAPVIDKFLKELHDMSKVYNL